MTDIAIVGFAQTPTRPQSRGDEVELVQDVVSQARDRLGLRQDDIGFTCSGSSDFLSGRPFSFVSAVDGLGAWPPARESHVEMDGAWALFEAWVRLQHGDIDTALVYAFGQSSLGAIEKILTAQLEPYTTAPLTPDANALAGLQAQALLLAEGATEADFAQVVSRNRQAGLDNPYAQLRSPAPARNQPVASPLDASDCPPVGDGAACVILARGDRARALCERPAWIRGMDHRIETHHLGQRNLCESPSTAVAAQSAGFDGHVDVAELHAPYSPQEIILRQALGGLETANVNPSGGALCANPVMVTGLIRLGEAAQAIIDGRATTALAHATSGPCLQHNLVAVLEAR